MGWKTEKYSNENKTKITGQISITKSQIAFAYDLIAGNPKSVYIFSDAENKKIGFRTLQLHCSGAYVFNKREHKKVPFRISGKNLFTAHKWIKKGRFSPSYEDDGNGNKLLVIKF